MTESFIASIGEVNAHEPNFGNKNLNKAISFLCFSTVTGFDTMKEEQRASAVGNILLRSAKTKLSISVDGDKDDHDHIFPNEASETISAETSVESEQPTYLTKQTAKRWASAGSSPKNLGSKIPEGVENETEKCLPYRKLRQAAELFNRDFFL